jgi:hypothetical protein
MIRCTFARTLAVASLVFALAAPVGAMDTGAPGPSPKDPPLDCTNRDNNICIECGQEGAQIACCRVDCDVIIGPQLPPPAPLKSPVIRKGLGSMNYFTQAKP